MELSQNVYDKQNTLHALNMAVVAAKTIVSSEDRIVLEQQYRMIIDRLKKGNIEDDKEIKSIYSDLLKGITSSLLAQDERKRFKQIYDREQKRAVLNALKGALTALPLPGDLPWLALGKTLLKGATAFFGYRAANKRLKEELSDELWHLEREKVLSIDALQRSLLDASWTLLRKYGFCDDQLVTQDDLIELEKALQQPDPARSCRMFADLTGKFRAYPPFWFYYGEAALQSGDEQTAEECFTRFDETNRDVLRKDPYKIQIAKYRLAISKNPTREFIRRQLEIIAEDDTQWLNNLYRGVLAFAIGDKDEGIRAVEHNIDFDYELEISSLVLKAMKQGTQHLWAALARAFYDGKGVEIDKAAAYKYACLARLYGDNSVNELIKNIEGSGGWFGFGKKAELSHAELHAAQAEAKSLYDREKAAQVTEEKRRLLMTPEEVRIEKETAERTRAEREAAEKVRKEAEERAAEENAERIRKKAAEQAAKDEAAERARKEAEELAAKEAAERARREAEERAAKEAAERARREAAEQAAKEAAERARKEAEQRERELMALLEKERAEREALEQKERERKEQQEREERERKEQQEREERERKLKEAIEQERARKAALAGGQKLTVGSIVTFGRYEQGDPEPEPALQSAEKEPEWSWPQFADEEEEAPAVTEAVVERKDTRTPIEWIVLAEHKGRYLLISKYGLDCKQYHHGYTGITWENCDLRKWLNDDFISAAFTEEEKHKILPVTNQNPNNAQYGTPGGNPTRDRVFLLSIDEANRLFKNDQARMCRPTDYAKLNGAGVNDDNGCGWWWLRSPGIGSSVAAGVGFDGAVYGGGAVSVYGYNVYNVNYAVRPALWVSNL